VHSVLLKREIPIVEHLTNLAAITSDQFHFSAVPPKVKGFGTFPVRAFAQQC
jgi:arylformamidase